MPRRRYPWGDEADLTRMNILPTNIRRTTGLGCFANGRSPYGCQDMAGSVAEWTRSLWGPVRFDEGERRYQNQLDYRYPYQLHDGRENLKAGPDVGRVLRGGGFDVDKQFARCATRGWVSPNYVSTYPGFRLVVFPNF